MFEINMFKPIVHQFNPENSFVSVQIGVSQRSQMFQYEVGYVPRQISCTPLTTFFDGDFYTKKR